MRWAAAGFNTRKITLDLTGRPASQARGDVVAPWRNVHVPLVLLPKLNHGTIVSDPSDELIAMVMEALEVGDIDAYRAWTQHHSTLVGGRLAQVDEDRWQQFIVRAVDERGDPISDYYVEVGSLVDGEFEILKHFALEVHSYTEDPSLRCFHVNLSELGPDARPSLWLRLTALSGTELIEYHGREPQTLAGSQAPQDEPDKWDVQIDLGSLLSDTGVNFFFPYTTTLVEIRLNREPDSRLLRFVGE